MFDRPPSDSNSTWELVGSQAELHTTRFRWKVDPSDPEQGAELIPGRCSPSSAVARLFQLHLPRRAGTQPVREIYVRRQDLVITYDSRAPDSVSPQIYWRQLTPQVPHCEGVEFVLSMQTDRLASRPECRLVSEFRREGSVHVAPLPANGTLSWARQLDEQFGPDTLQPLGCRPCILVRPADADWSYVEMLYPGDFTLGGITRQPESEVLQIAWTLFAESLEKGVIRRARLRGVVIPREQDERVAEELWGEFLRSSLPLTT